MHDERKAAPAKVAALQALTAEFTGISRTAQRERLRRAFELFPRLNTREVREYLDILHPAGRVKDLRGEGCSIATLWTTIETGAGVRHRVADYLWAREVNDA